MVVVHGEQRRPRALLEDLPDPLVEEITPLFGSSRVVSSGERVDASEYDVLVTCTDVRRDDHLHVLALGPDHAGAVWIDQPSGGASDKAQETADVAQSADVLARQLDIPESVTGSLRVLIEETLVPVVAAIDSARPQWRAHQPTGFGGSGRWPPLVGPQALLTTHKPDEVMAFAGTRAGADGGVIVALPVMPREVSRWVRWFLTHAKESDAAAFPVDLAWHEDDEWTPPTLRAALDELAATRQKRADLLAELDAAEQQARAAADAAREEAGASVWRLLTAQGSDLCSAVQDALTELGYTVTDSDAGREANDPKMEDLRVTDRNAPDWIALAEVKGFNRGASPRGGTQLIGRPVQAYVTETGRLPGGLWYFVNHLIDTPPGQRPQPLERDSIADTLAQRDGALIDTRDLLRAVLAVRRGEARPEQVRASMRASRGRWHWPEAELPNSSR